MHSFRLMVSNCVRNVCLRQTPVECISIRTKLGGKGKRKGGSDQNPFRKAGTDYTAREIEGYVKQPLPGLAVDAER